MEELINRLYVYREEMKKLAEKAAKESGNDCFKFDAKPFDEAIAILGAVEIFAKLLDGAIKGGES